MLGACKKDYIDEIKSEDPNYQVDTIDVNPFIAELRSLSSDTLFISCVKIPLPLDLLQESGNSITINTIAELDSAEMLADAVVDFVYPFGAVIESMPVQITELEDLATSILLCSTTTATCADLKPNVLLFYNALNIFTINNYPYTINYPVTLIVEGNTIVVNNNDEYVPAIGGDPSKFLEAQLVYPITITQFGRNITLTSDDDVCSFYYTLLEPCENKPAHIQLFFNGGSGSPTECAYFIDYPVQINLNGSVIEIGSRNEYLEVLNALPNAYDDITLVYPVSAINIDFDPIIFETEDDICNFLNGCQ
jgi:hypothetical protein